MRHGYIFNNTEYHRLDKLALAFQDDFTAAIDCVFNDLKAFVSFVRGQNKTKANKIVDIVYSCRYKNSAMTFIIYELLEAKRVIIDGTMYTLKSFCEALCNQEPSKDSPLYTFMEDLGFERTFRYISVVGAIVPLEYSELYDKYCYHPFTRLYLTSFVSEGYDRVDILGRLRAIATLEGDIFSEATKLFKEPRVLLTVSKEFDFKTALELSLMDNPIFQALRLYSAREDYSLLCRLIDNTYYWWYFDNIDKYHYKKKAVFVYQRAMRLRAEYDSLLGLISSNRIQRISYDRYSGIAEAVYGIYLEMARLYQEGMVLVKDGYTKDLFVFTIPYGDTYLTKDFIAKSSLVIAGIDDVGVVVCDEEVSLNLDRKRDSIKQMRSFSLCTFILSTLCGVMITLLKLIDVDLFKSVDSVFSMSIEKTGVSLYLISYISISILFVMSILGYLTTIFDKTVVFDYELLHNKSRIPMYLTERKKRVCDRGDKINKRIRGSHVVERILMMAFMSICMTLLSQALLDFVFIPLELEYKNILLGVYSLLYFIIPMILGIILLFIKKRKGALDLLIMLIVCILVGVVLNLVL